MNFCIYIQQTKIQHIFIIQETLITSVQRLSKLALCNIVDIQDKVAENIIRVSISCSSLRIITKHAIRNLQINIYIYIEEKGKKKKRKTQEIITYNAPTKYMLEYEHVSKTLRRR